jgi:enoyl-CoA hydratase/carnithine racemase
LFSQPEVPAGVVPRGGGIERLLALTSRAKELEIVIGGEDFDARTAERYGWVNRAIADDELDDFVDRFARRIASFDQYAITEAKLLLNRPSMLKSEDFLESQAFFLKATLRPELSKREGKARKVAIAAGADFELRLGYYLGQV